MFRLQRDFEQREASPVGAGFATLILRTVTKPRENSLEPSSRRSIRRRRGFTLVELVVVLGLIVVISAIGFTSLQSHLPRYRLIRAVKAFKSDLLYLRNLSISTSRETRLRLVSTGGDCAGDLETWGGEWALEIGDRSNASQTWEYLPPDAAGDGSDDDQSGGIVELGAGGNLASRRVCLSEWTSLTGPSTGNSDSIVFSPRGRLVNPNADFVDEAGWIAVTFVNQSAAANGVDDHVRVMINRVGNIAVDSSLDVSPNSATASR